MNVTTSSTIRSARLDDRPQLITLFADAFLDSPVGDWLIADIDTRYGIYLDYFAIHIGHALTDGIIDTTDAVTGAAIWYPSSAGAPPDYAQQLAAACGPWLPRFQLLDASLGHQHPTEPHHYLAFVAVHPDVQNHGTGSALLAHHHAHLDEHGIPAFLEASNANNYRLYPRHGYADLPGAPFHLPDAGPPIWPMWRASTNLGQSDSGKFSDLATDWVGRSPW